MFLEKRVNRDRGALPKGSNDLQGEEGVSTNTSVITTTVHGWLSTEYTSDTRGDG